MSTPRFRPVNQQCVSPDPEDSQLRALASQSEPVRVPSTRPRGWSHHRPKSPRVVIPAQQPRDLLHMDKRRRRGSSHTPVVGRQQAPRKAKPLPSIEESAQKGPFDPYAFLSHPSTPSLSSPSPNHLKAPGKRGVDISPQDGKRNMPHSPSLRPNEQSFGHRQSTVFRCSPRKHGSSDPFMGYIATDEARPTLSLNPRPSASNDASNEVKRERSTRFTPFRDPVIRRASVAASLQDTQVRERKLEENGVVELDRDEFALQRFLKVQNEMTDLEAILMKGKKRHVFEQMKRNAATKSLRGVERILAENEATPTPSGRQKSLNEQHSEVMSKVVDMKTETSQCGPAIIEDAPSTSVSSKDRTDRSQKDHQSDHGLIHPSRRHVFDHSEGSQRYEKSNAALPPKPLKCKELPGMGLIFNPRPNPPQEARKHRNDKLPRDLKRREVNINEVKDSIEKTNDADIENAIDSAQDWLQRGNALEQEARANRWQADPNWKRLTVDQIDAMRKQSSIPPAKFYGRPSKSRPPPSWRQPPITKTTTDTLARVDKILAKVNKEQAPRLLQNTRDNGKKTNGKDSEEKVQTSTREESKHPPAIDTKSPSMPKATSSSREGKRVIDSVGHEVDYQRSMRDDRPAVEPRVNSAGDTVERSQTKSFTKKRKRDTDVPATAVIASTMKNGLESRNLPSMKKAIEGTHMAVTLSPVKKKSKSYSGLEAIKRILENAKEPSTPPTSNKRKKSKETMGQHEAAGEGKPSKTKKRKGSGHTQESDEAVVEEAPPETLFDRLTKMKKKREKALALREATTDRLQSTIPTPEASKTNNFDRAPPTAPEPAIEDAWQPMIDDADPPSPPQTSPSRRKKHKSRRHRQADTPAAIAVDGAAPEPIEPQAPAPPSNQPTHSAFNHLRRRHQSLPLRLPPDTTIPTANANTIPPQPQPPSIHPQPNLYDLNLLAIRARLSNLEAVVAANPAPATPVPAPNNTLTPLAARKLLLPPLPRTIPPGSTRLSDAELIQIGKKANKYERHKGAPYAFSWYGRLYAEYDYLLDWADDRGRAGWDHKEKSRVKH